MNNEVILNNLIASYDSLKYFIIKNNVLYFKDNENIYNFPLIKTNLSTINPNLFLLKPRDIYRVLYLLELLNKETLSKNDIEFITQYTNKYLKLETMRIENQEVDENEVTCLSIPIYTSYDPINIEMPASKLIHKLLNKHSEEIESSKSHSQRLILTNPNFANTFEDENNTLSDFGKAGFTTVILIIGVVIITSLYITFFILNK